MALAEDRSEHSVTWEARTIAPLAFRYCWQFPVRNWTVTLFAPLAISVVLLPALRRQRTGIGTEFLAHREKVEMTRLDSTSELSLVPVGRAHRAYTRAFCAHPRRMPQT